MTETDAGPWHASDERALPARSVIASTLLGVRPPRLPTSLLVQSCGLFGITDGTARVAISRMVRAGELVADDGGYALGGPLRSRQARQDVSRQAATHPWTPDDGWRLVIVVAEGRSASDRADLRRAAIALRLAERREGAWMRPDNLARGTLPEDEAVVRAQGEELRAHPAGDGAVLAATLWDLDGWSARADRLAAALEVSRPTLDRGERGALHDGFVLSAAVLRHFQSDPLLPDSLLPHRWPGARLRAIYDGWDAAFKAVWADWYRAARRATHLSGKNHRP